MLNDKIKIMIVEDNLKEQDAFAEAMEQYPMLEVTLMTGRQSEAITYITNEPVDAVILDLELEEGDGLTFLDLLKEELLISPFVVVTTNNESLIISDRVKKSGADFIFRKSNQAYSAKFILDFIIKTAKFFVPVEIQKERLRNEELLQSQMEKAYRLEIDRRLSYISISPNYRGTQYLKDAIMMVIREGVENQLQVKSVYNYIARRYNTGSQNVERNIRTCIEKSWSTAELGRLKEYYSSMVDPLKGKPTNREFIYQMAEKIIRTTKTDL